MGEAGRQATAMDPRNECEGDEMGGWNGWSAGAIRQAAFSVSRPCGRSKSRAGPLGTMPLGFTERWLW